MSFISRMFPGFALAQRAAESAETGKPLVKLPPRENVGDVSDREAVGLIPVYRALQVMTTSAAQLPLNFERGGQTVIVKHPSEIPALVRKPDPDMDRSDWIEQAVLSLALDGNLFLRKIKNPDGTTAAARILPPSEVTITRDPKTRRIWYNHDGQKLSSADINHQTLMRLPGQVRGLGPIQAARQELGSAADVRDYSTNWFRGSGQPNGIISTKSSKTQDEAKAIRDRWNEAQADPDNITGVRVIGGDSEYTPLLLKPADAQWLEVRKFTVTDFARLFGIPSALMLVSLDGNSLTYSNVEQEWLAFARFTLMQYLRKLEEALTDLSPAGQTIRFNLEGLLRSDTSSRYASHRVALEAGFLTVDEVRRIEGRPPLTPEQWEEVNNRIKTPSVTTQETPA